MPEFFHPLLGRETSGVCQSTRIRGKRGLRLLRQRGEKLERWNQHLYDRGGMRRLHLRGRENILKRLIVHSGAANLGLLMRKLFG
jgi:transposase